MTSVMVYMGKPNELKLTLKNGFPQLFTLGGKTLIDFSLQINDLNSAAILMDDLNDRENTFVHENDIVNIIKNFKPRYKNVIMKVFKNAPHFDFVSGAYAV